MTMPAISPPLRLEPPELLVVDTGTVTVGGCVVIVVARITLVDVGMKRVVCGRVGCGAVITIVVAWRGSTKGAIVGGDILDPSFIQAKSASEVTI